MHGKGNLNTALFWEYDTRLGRRWNLDPVDQISISNYATFANNPILFSDILGDTVQIFGENKKARLESFTQMNESTSLKLKYHNKTGTVSYDKKSRALTPADELLKAAIDDECISVKINATFNNYNTLGNQIYGGTFDGNLVNSDGSIDAFQTVNPNKTKIIDEYLGLGNGVTVLHETLEAYLGAKLSPGTGVPSLIDVKSIEFQNYQNAHDAVLKIDSRFRAPNLGAQLINIKGRDKKYKFFKAVFIYDEKRPQREGMLINNTLKP